MRTWRVILQTIGALNLIEAVWGCYAQAISAFGVLHHTRSDPREPFFSTAFWTMWSSGLVLLLLLIIVSVMLLTLRDRAAVAHASLMLVILVYAFFPGTLWLLPNGVGSSIAGASGVANLGIGVILFYPVPYLYPLLSTACVVIARNRLKAARSTLTSPPLNV